MKLQICQVGEPVLRQAARELSIEEIKSDFIQNLISYMKTTMHDAPGVGLAAPQIGEPLQLVVINDRPEYHVNIAPELLAQRERTVVPFHVIINPKLVIEDEEDGVEFFEGCLSMKGYVGKVRRARRVVVTCLNELGEPVKIKAKGWYARILQHEIDHLKGNLYVDRISDIKTLMTMENYFKYWQ